jgi:serine/threonine protein kinase
MTDLARSSGETVQIGSVIAGRYKVEKLLGRGGFGAVYKVEHATTGKAQVLKVLRPNLADDPTQVQRFFNEAKVSSRLSHPNTVNVFDFGQTEGGLLFIAMELLDGAELGHALRERGTLDPVRTIHIAMAVLKSLAEAHTAGLVHRDLKPDNIFLCKHAGEAEFVKVIDFGIAKPMDAGTDAGLTRTGFTVGTPKYMSPEQVLNKPLDCRSDLYALGVILYQCLSGDVPFAGPSPMETLMMHLQQEPRPLQEVVAQPLPAGLAAVVMQSLRKHPWERFADAEDMLDALEEVLIGAGRLMPTQKRAMSAKLRAVTPTDVPERTEAHAGPVQGSKPVTEPTRVSMPGMALPLPEPSQPVVQAREPVAPTRIAQTSAPEAGETLPLARPMPGPTQRSRPRGAVLAAGVAVIAAGLGVVWWQADRPQAHAAPAARTGAEALPARADPGIAMASTAPTPAPTPPVAPPAQPKAAPEVPVPAAVPAKPAPAWLGQADVEQAVARAQAAVLACQRGHTPGVLAVQVEVDAGGTVTQANLAAPARDQPWAGCVVAAVQALPFAPGTAMRTGILVFPGAVEHKADAPKVRRARSEKHDSKANGDEAL